MAGAYRWPGAVAYGPARDPVRPAELHGRIVSEKQPYDPFPSTAHPIEAGLEGTLAEVATGRDVRLVLCNGAELGGKLIAKGEREVIVGTAFGEVPVDLRRDRALSARRHYRWARMTQAAPRNLLVFK